MCYKRENCRSVICDPNLGYGDKSTIKNVPFSISPTEYTDASIGYSIFNLPQSEIEKVNEEFEESYDEQRTIDLTGKF